MTKFRGLCIKRTMFGALLLTMCLMATSAMGQVCGDADAGDCCVGNGTPACNDAACCDTVCAADAFCCETEWDTICAGAAADLCGDLCGGGGGDSGCDNCTPLSDGITLGSTLGAPNEADITSCTSSDTIVVWYCYTASCDGTVTMDTCGVGTNYDTALAAFADCPAETEIACNDDTCGLQSEISFAVVAGDIYYIRVSGFGGQSGSFELNVTCVSQSCNGNAGDCCAKGGNGTPGCDDASCCAAICAIDPSCCDVEWDGACATQAGDICEACVESDLIWFNDEATFVAFNEGDGKVLKGLEDFEEGILPPAAVDGFNDTLQSGIPNLPDAFPYPEGMTGLPNLAVQSNFEHAPAGENPRGLDGLAAASNGFLGAASDIVIANTFVDSLDLIFTTEKSGVGFNTLALLGGASVEIRVYGTDNAFLGLMTMPADTTGFNFAGVWSATPIGRINIFDPGNGAEGADNIQAWEAGKSICPADIDGDGSVGTTDLLILLAAWGTAGPGDIDGDGTVGTADLLILLAAWGPCP